MYRWREQTINIYLAADRDVDTPTRHHRYNEAARDPGAVPNLVLFAIVDLVRNVPGIVCRKNCRAIHRLPALRFEHPDDSIFRAIGGDGRCRSRVDDLVPAASDRLAR